MTWVDDQLWVAVNERDELGSDLVPDYMTSVEENGYYGWPYTYYGDHVDERVAEQPPAGMENALVPDYALGPHTGSLGLLYVEDGNLPPSYENGMFIGQHGSWNREPRSGYKVIHVPYQNGKPRPGVEATDILDGFLREDRAYGRPVGLELADDGSLLVADDVGNTIWRVTAADGPTSPPPLAAVR
jgi:glucose/arabinose dehydrogenase